MFCINDNKNEFQFTKNLLVFLVVFLFLHLKKRGRGYFGFVAEIGFGLVLIGVRDANGVVLVGLILL